MGNTSKKFDTVAVVNENVALCKVMVLVFTLFTTFKRITSFIKLNRTLENILNFKLEYDRHISFKRFKFSVVNL